MPGAPASPRCGPMSYSRSCRAPCIGSPGRERPPIRSKRSINPRRRLHSRGTFDGCDEIEEASVVSGELVVPGCDASEVFDLVDEAFDEITFFVEMGVEAAPFDRQSVVWGKSVSERVDFG